MKKFEYKHHNGILEERDLNSFGNDGWELVAHSAVPIAGILGGSNELRQYYVFKREKNGQVNS